MRRLWWVVVGLASITLIVSGCAALGLVAAGWNRTD